MVQDTSNLLLFMELPYRQSADLHTSKHSNLGSVHRHFTENPQTPHEESAELP